MTRSAWHATGRSPFLARLLDEKGSLDARDLSRAAAHGDPASVELITNAGRQIGRMLAGIVNFFNPSLIVIGGGVAGAGDLLLATIRESVYRRSLPLATRDLVVKRSTLEGLGGRDRRGRHGDRRALLAAPPLAVARRRDAGRAPRARRPPLVPRRT